MFDKFSLLISFNLRVFIFLIKFLSLSLLGSFISLIKSITVFLKILSSEVNNFFSALYIISILIIKSEKLMKLLYSSGVKIALEF